MFSERVRQLRKNAGLTQVQFAREFNVANGTIAMWETGKREPDFETIQRIADYFDVTVDYLLGRTDKKKASPSEDELATLLQEPHMKEICEAVLQLTPEHRRLILAQIDAVKALEDGAKK